MTRKDAETIELRVRHQMQFERHGIDTDRQDHKYERFVQDYYLPHIEANAPASLEKALVICKASMPYFKGKQMRLIKPADIERFKNSRFNLKTKHSTQRKPATVHRELAIISGIFSLAVKNDIVEYNPCSRVSKPKFDNIQDKILRVEDEAKFFSFITTDWTRDICKLVLNTGLRQNDVMRLTSFQVDLPNKVIRLTQGKTRRQVHIALNSVAVEILERRMNKYKGYLFASPKTGETNGSVRHSIQRACIKAEIPVLTIRDLRRTFGTRLMQHADVSTAARMLGHSDLRSIHRYQRSIDLMQKAADSLVDSATVLPTAIQRKR